MASAVPLYQFSSMRCCGGRTSTYSSSWRVRKFQPAVRCRSRLRALYWVSTSTFLRPLLMQLDRVKSMIRYSPPKGTAGLARSRVKGSNLVPLPPANTNVSTSFTASPSATSARAEHERKHLCQHHGRHRSSVQEACGRHFTTLDKPTRSTTPCAPARNAPPHDDDPHNPFPGAGHR